MRFNISEIPEIVKGKLLRPERQTKTINGVSINSKKTRKGNLFIAIKGERFDGHDFIAEAVDRGAGAVIAEGSFLSRERTLFRNGRSHIPIIAVNDTVKAMGYLARAYRDRFRIPVVAVTGSAGKTTTKELAAAVLKTKFQVLKNAGTENNHIGVPLTLFKLNTHHQIAVLELGTNRPGDIRWLTHIVNPNVVMLTNIGEAHLELLKSSADVFKEKSEIIKGMRNNGTVILNNDDLYLRRLPKLFSGYRFITYGIDGFSSAAAGRKNNDHTASSIRVTGSQKLTYRLNRKYSLSLKSPVKANVYNALAAVSCGRIYNVGYESIQKSLASFRFNNRRQTVNRLGRYWIIDDSYNANPVSVRSAIETLASFRSPGRKIFICADMLELGRRSKDLHDEVGKLAVDSRIDMVLTFGKMAKHIARGARVIDKQFPAFHFQQLPFLYKKLFSFCQPQDVILIKGSRGMQTDKIVEYVSEKFRRNN